MNKKFIWLAAASWALSACSQLDMQGHDPKDYYANNPIKNKVGMQQAYAFLSLDDASSAGKLSSHQRAALSGQLALARPAAVDSLLVESQKPLPPALQKNLINSFAQLGYRAPVQFEQAGDLEGNNTLRVTADYAVVITPDCPDWKTSPVTTYSNTKQGNIGCATVSNLGLMLEDPRDLERGSSSAVQVSPHGQRSTDAITHYRHGMTAPAPLSPVAQGASPAAASQ